MQQRVVLRNGPLASKVFNGLVGHWAASYAGELLANYRVPTSTSFHAAAKNLPNVKHRCVFQKLFLMAVITCSSYSEHAEFRLSALICK